MWYMRPVRVGIEVPQPIEVVFDFLDVMANHEPFTNHILTDWQYSGPERGIGARATVSASAGGRSETVEIEVVAARCPETIVERNVSAGGRRIGTGTYTLKCLPTAGTSVTFEYAWQQPLLTDRLAAPLIRRILARANQRAMHRLAEQLATLAAAPGSTIVADPRPPVSRT